MAPLDESMTSSARSSAYHVTNQSLSQQELTDIMFASVKNVPKNNLDQGNKAQTGLGGLTAMVQKRK